MKLKIEIELDELQTNALKKQVVERVGIALSPNKVKAISEKVLTNVVQNQLVSNNMAGLRSQITNAPNGVFFNFIV